MKKRLSKTSGHFSMYIYILAFLYITIFISCQTDKNADEFDNIITQNIQEDSTVNFAETFPFDWDKMYVFSRDHYPEARWKSISKITGTNYRGGHNFDDRLILFIKDKEIVFEVINTYHSDEFDDDLAPFKYNFQTGKHIPEYFTPKNAVFQLKKFRNAYWLWQNIPNQNLDTISLKEFWQAFKQDLNMDNRTGLIAKMDFPIRGLNLINFKFAYDCDTLGFTKNEKKYSALEINRKNIDRYYDFVFDEVLKEIINRISFEDLFKKGKIFENALTFRIFPREYIKTKCYRDINLLLYFHKTGAQWRIQIGGI